MNKLALAKFIVFLLTGLLIAGFGLIFHKIAKNNLKSNNNQNVFTLPKKSYLSLNHNESVQETFSCQNFLCLSIASENKIKKIHIINPQTGDQIHTIFISSDTQEEK
ncbi:MAG: hypothetical protein J6V53_07355 [Alphaproteobacteria bacterium]|nr:hypothetical protein [Alphaproteobacteria bacterium]